MSNIIDHVGFAVSDFEQSKRFYVETLATLGIDLLADFTVGHDQHAGFGKGNPTFWIGSGKPLRAGIHVAFTATSRADVQSFYAVALSMGGRDNGVPGVRALYHPDYYGAYVLDPDGHNIEAVCHGTE